MPLAAQSIQPTASQIEAFKQLSLKEKQALADSVGVDIPKQLPKIKNTLDPVDPPQAIKPRGVQYSQQKTHIGNRSDANHSGVNQSDSAADLNFKDDQHARSTLKPFGYELFAGTPTTFAPATNIPVSSHYVVGPGDTVIVQLYGKENATYELMVSREGVIQFPEIGPITINGLIFSELKEQINSLVSEQMIGVKASITMGALRSIQVFVLGEAFQPGSYTISSLSTITHALFASGGVKTIGSLRNIQLKRQGKIVTTLDLYDLLLKGDNSKDVHLLPGDVVFIPTVGPTAAITGEVKRPAIYELKKKATAADLVALSGGYKATAYPEASRIERIDHRGRRTVLDINLSAQQGKKQGLSNGDVVTVYSVLDKLENIVLLSGHVHRPGHFSWRKGMRVTDLIHSIADLKQNPDLSVGLIKHQSGPGHQISFKQFNIHEAIAAKRSKISSLNPLLMPRDEVIVFEAGNQDRLEQLKAYIDILKQQNLNATLPNTVEILGSVQVPGDYPLTYNMSSADLIALSGGLQPAARNSHAIVLNRTEQAERYHVRAYSLKSIAALRQDKLRAGSRLLILSNESKEGRKSILEPIIEQILSQSWQGNPAPVITVGGPVRFPGDYPYIPGMKIKDLLELAGGLREEAYLYSAEVTRRHIEVGNTFEIKHHHLDLGKRADKGLAFALNARDKVIIKQIPEWGETITVSVNGEVRFPGTYPIIRGETLLQLIKRAGGLTKESDPLGAVFLRETLKEKEAKALEDYQEQLKEDIVRLEQEEAQNQNGTSIQDKKAAGSHLLEELSETEALGRLVINLPLMMSGKRAPLILREGDSLTIPRLIQEVSIVGEVHHPTSYVFEKGLNAKKFLNLSGGVSKNGDAKRAYLISRAGTVKPLRKFNFFGLKFYHRIQAGDTIVVPVDTDQVSAMTYWVQASQILFQLATTAAALDTVGAL